MHQYTSMNLIRFQRQIWLKNTCTIPRRLLSLCDASVCLSPPAVRSISEITTHPETMASFSRFRFRYTYRAGIGV